MVKTMTATRPNPSLGFNASIVDMPVMSGGALPVPYAQPLTQVPALRPFTQAELMTLGDKVIAQSTAVTDKINASVRASGLGESGKIMNDIVMTAKGYDPKQGLRGGLFKWLGMTKEQIQARYETVEQRILALKAQLDKELVTIKQADTDIAQLAQQQLDNHRQYTVIIEAAQARLESMRAHVPVPDTTDLQSVQAAREYNEIMESADRKITNLIQLRDMAVSLATMAHSQAKTNRDLYDDYSTVINLTIPNWKQVMSVLIISEQQLRQAKVSNAVKDANNASQRRLNEVFKESTVKTVETVNRGVYDIDTITDTHQTLIDTLTQVDAINKRRMTERAQERQLIESKAQEFRQFLTQRI